MLSAMPLKPHTCFQMPSQFIMVSSTVRRSWVLFSVLILFLLIDSYGAEANNNNVTCIGLIIDVNTRIGKEEKIAMEIAAQNYNTSSKTQKLSLYIQDSLRVTSAGKQSLSLAHFVNIKISVTSILMEYVNFGCSRRDDQRKKG